MANTTVTKAPMKVYLDQNVLNDIAPKGGQWSETKWEKKLIELSNTVQIEVWASPANCLEIALTNDFDHRNQMAIALNTLVRGQRMMHDYHTFLRERNCKKASITVII